MSADHDTKHTRFSARNQSVREMSRAGQSYHMMKDVQDDHGAQVNQRRGNPEPSSVKEWNPKMPLCRLCAVVSEAFSLNIGGSCQHPNDTACKGHEKTCGATGYNRHVGALE